MSEQRHGFSEADVRLIWGMMPDGTQPGEFELFLATASRMGLDPLRKEIHATRRGGRMVHIVSIDGYRLMAERTGFYVGQEGPWWCGKELGEDGKPIWVDAWLSGGQPAASKVTVMKSIDGTIGRTSRVAHWGSFGSNRNLWGSMPEHMLAKVAESHALRAAFPGQLAGTYTQEEMDQSEPGGKPKGGKTFEEALASSGVKEPEPEPKKRAPKKKAVKKVAKKEVEEVKKVAKKTESPDDESKRLGEELIRMVNDCDSQKSLNGIGLHGNINRLKDLAVDHDDCSAEVWLSRVRREKQTRLDDMARPDFDRVSEEVTEWATSTTNVEMEFEDGKRKKTETQAPSNR